jgi:hypothetical protein
MALEHYIYPGLPPSSYTRTMVEGNITVQGFNPRHDDNKVHTFPLHLSFDKVPLATIYA